MNKRIFLSVVVALASATAVARQEDCGCDGPPLPQVVALVNGVRITPKDIDEPIQDALEKLRQQAIDARRRELGLQINSRLLDAEAKKEGISAAKLLQNEVLSKVKEPTEAAAQLFFEQNRGRLSGEFKDLKESIMQHLKKQNENEEAKKLADRLRATAEVKILVREATPPADDAGRSRVFATIGDQAVTSDDVERALAPLLSQVRRQIYTLRENELESRIREVLLQQEALARKMTIRSLLDDEVTPQVRKITDADVRDFYEKNKERISGEYDQMRGQMTDYLQKAERQKAEVAYVKRLQQKATVDVHLVPPPPDAASAAEGGALPKTSQESLNHDR